MGESSILDHIIAALRGRNNPDNKKLKAPDMQLSGYHEYVGEQKAQGEPVQSYEEWIKGQSASPAGQ